MSERGFPFAGTAFIAWRSHVLRAWRLLVLLAVSQPTLATDYFVSPRGDDRNAGTSLSSPWRTIAKANQIVRAGDIVYLRGGEYVDDPIAPLSSGRWGNPITYTGFPGERPVITSNAPLGLEHGILFRRVSNVEVQGVSVNGRARSPAATIVHFATLEDASFTEIRDSEFVYAEGWSGIEIIGDSHHNTVLRNRIDFVGEYDRNGDDFGDSIWIEATAHHNLIASNMLSHGGHDLLRTKGYENIVQDNVFNNNWSDVLGEGLGARNLTLDGTRNVFQRNVVQGARQSVDSPRNQAMKVEGVGNVVRHNLLVDNHHDAFTSEVGSWQRYAADNRIYNNTVYGNGGAAWRIRFYTNDQRPSGNVFKNNLVYNNRQLPPNATGDTDFWVSMQGSGVTAPGDNAIVSNMVAKTMVGDARVYFDPPYVLTGIADAERRYPAQVRDNIVAVPRFVKSLPAALADFELSPGSPGIDAAAPLTTTATAGAGFRIPVRDARYFSDGSELVAGDVISVGPERDLVVSLVDITTNELYVDRQIGWAMDAPVQLEYVGTAPDIGAIESGRGAQARLPRPMGQGPAD